MKKINIFMSTELFRKYIDILVEDSPETVISPVSDITRLKIALQELETVLKKYEQNIYESLTEAPRTPEQQAAMDAARKAISQTSRPVAPGDLPRGGTANPTRDWRSETTQAEQAAREAEAARQRQIALELEQSLQKGQRLDALKKGAKTTGKLAIAGAVLAYLGPKAWDLIKSAYHSFTKYKFSDLAPNDQALITKNIEIIQPYYSQDQFSQLPTEIQTRLISVAVQLGKLNSGLHLPDDKLPLTRGQTIQAAHGLIKDSMDHRHRLNSLHQLSDVEQMAVLRALVTEGWFDDAGSAIWDSDILRYLGWPGVTAMGTAGAAWLYNMWKVFSEDYDEKNKTATGTSAPATPAAAEVPADQPKILGPDGKPLPSTRPAAPTGTPSIPKIEPPKLGTSKLAAFKEFLKKYGKYKGAALRAVLATALTGLAVKGTQMYAASHAAGQAAKDAAKWTGNDPDRNAIEVIQQLTDLNAKNQFWDDTYLDDQQRKAMLEVVIAYCNRHPKDPGCAENKDNLCSLMPGLKGC